MNGVFHASYALALVFIFGETGRRGLGYFSINATTMIEDYLAGVILLLAALFWRKKHRMAGTWMTAAWAYATGTMFVPFFAHLEAFLRNVTMRMDQPHTEVNAIVVKGLMWALCVVCLVITVRKQSNSVA
ncbi:MAG: hypothetical protein V4463_11210 [Pseudomonadota bacterium]